MMFTIRIGLQARLGVCINTHDGTVVEFTCSICLAWAVAVIVSNQQSRIFCNWALNNYIHLSIQLEFVLQRLLVLVLLLLSAGSGSVSSGIGCF